MSLNLRQWQVGGPQATIPHASSADARPWSRQDLPQKLSVSPSELRSGPGLQTALMLQQPREGKGAVAPRGGSQTQLLAHSVSCCGAPACPKFVVDRK
jgi:hypothetical protein